MQPIAQKLPITPVIPPIEKMPNVVKLEVLKFLGATETAKATRLNKSWEKMSSNQILWGNFAKQLKVNSRKEVTEHLRYQPVIEVIETFLSRKKTSAEDFNLTRSLDYNLHAIPWDKSNKEKYHIILEKLMSDPEITLRFLKSVFEKEPTTTEIQAIKQLIEDDVLQNATEHNKAMALERVSATQFRHLGLFQFIVNKLRNTSSRDTIFLKAALYISAVPFLKILCEEGMRPNRNHLFHAAKTSEEGSEHLQLLLDYCDKEERDEAVMNLKRDSAWHNDDTTIRERNEKGWELISKAPPATYGSKGK